jgi:hypothetical protein
VYRRVKKRLTALQEWLMEQGDEYDRNVLSHKIEVDT